MADKIKNIKGSLILLLAAFIWGTAFVAQTSGADSVGTFTFNTCRSVVGALFLLLVIVLLDSYGKRTSGGGKDTLQEPYSRTKWPVKGGVLCGIILFVAMSLQQYGIGIYPAGVAASGRCGGIRQGRLSYGNVCGAGCHLFRMDGQKAASADCGIHCRLYCRNVSFVYVRRICRDLYGRCVRVFVCSRFYVSYSYS